MSNENADFKDLEEYFDEASSELLNFDLDTDEDKRRIVKLIRQHLLNMMDCVEQTGIDEALQSAVEAFDKRCIEEGLGE